MTREEAIAVIRKNYPHVGFSGTEFETALRELIPELAESEDEKIRKGIIKFFSENEVTPIISYEAKLAWLNWLERQKTPSVSFDKPPIGFDAGSAVVYHNDESEDEIHRKWILEYLYDGLRKTDKQFKEQFKSAIAWLEKQKEQKPNYCHYGGDPNIERCRCCSAACSGRLADEQKPPITGNDFGWIDELKHDLEHPEELDQKVDDVLKQRKGIKTLEWSEEDKKIAETICKEGDLKPSEKRWLKSLRPHWKPSEEQMRQLGYVAEQNKHNMLGQELMTLYNDLKKLM